ncbi:MAG TPA: serine/threonine-protein kinase [Polyangiaceae bacterium]|nr:serine/threonine-protein kinase [Polyangiaceae bacterium]
MNATSIDVTSSNAITFGYMSELARAGRIIAGRHRLQAPLPDASSRAASGAAGSAYGGSLWRAEALWSGQPVLVELLDPAIADDASLTELFMAEARAASGVSSPFVSRVLDFGIESSAPFLITELDAAEAGDIGPRFRDTLATRIAARHLPSFAEFAHVFHDVSRGVEAMHARNVFHRDLRSDRVTLLRARTASAPEREAAKLSFGISKILNDTLELVRTMARRSVAPASTPQYASPEQVLGTAPLGVASDVWSLAIIAFEALTGELPFAGATVGERLVQICAGPARIPSSLAALPPGFDAWFARGVEKSPADRWASVREMSEALLDLGPSSLR